MLKNDGIEMSDKEVKKRRVETLTAFKLEYYALLKKYEACIDSVPDSDAGCFEPDYWIGVSFTEPKRKGHNFKFSTDYEPL